MTKFAVAAGVLASLFFTAPKVTLARSKTASCASAEIALAPVPRLKGPAMAYCIMDLGTLGGTQSEATAINDRGEIVGFSSTSSGVVWSAFLHTKDGMKALGTLGGAQSAAYGINDLGEVVGYSDTSSGEVHAFLWTADNGFKDLGTLGGSVSFAGAINFHGEVVGASTLTGTPEEPMSSLATHAFLWTAKDGMKDLGTLGGNRSVATAINDRGEVVGYSEISTGEIHAFLWTAKGGMKDLGTLGGDLSMANGINNEGQIVGWSTIPQNSEPDPSRPFLWTAKSGMKDIGTLGGEFGSADAINDRGEVVGSSTTPEGPYQASAFLWTAKGGMKDLEPLDEIPGDGVSGAAARDLNELGEVVGISTLPTGDEHAVLWSRQEHRGSKDKKSKDNGQREIVRLSALGTLEANPPRRFKVPGPMEIRRLQP